MRSLPKLKGAGVPDKCYGCKKEVKITHFRIGSNKNFLYCNLCTTLLILSGAELHAADANKCKICQED